MYYEVSECVGCGLPCVSYCRYYEPVPYYKCDECGEEELTEDEIHHVDGEDLCDDCYNKEYPDGE